MMEIYDVPLIVYCEDLEKLSAVANALSKIGMHKFKYEVYKDFGVYFIELRMRYKHYLKLMKLLQKNGYNLRGTSHVDLISEVIKFGD